MHNIRKTNKVNIEEDGYEDDFIKEEEEKLNQTSRTMQEEEARTKMEQAETKRQMFINVQPYVAQTLNINPSGYSNPFSFGNKAQNNFTAGAHLDLLQFDISSHDDSDATSQ